MSRQIQATIRKKSAPKPTEKLLQIQYLYLDLHTCKRCIGTDAVLDEVVEELRPALKLAGYKIEYSKKEMTTVQLAEQYHFLSSPTILLNGNDIFGKVEENDCGCCGDIAGTAVNCRVFSHNGKTYEIPTRQMLADAILKAVYAPPISNADPYVLPQNLRNFYAGKAHQKSNKCC